MTFKWVPLIGFWIKIFFFSSSFFCTLGNHQGWDFAHLLLALLLKIAHFKERLWAICSDRSWQKSDYEQIAQVANQKWSTVSNLLRSLTTNEQPWADPSGCSWHKSNLSESLVFSEWISLLLTKNERFTQKYLNKIIFFVSLKKWAIHSLPLF